VDENVIMEGAYERGGEEVSIFEKVVYNIGDKK